MGKTQKLSDDWEWAKLGDMCNTSSGGTPLKSNDLFYKGGTIPWLKSGEVAQGFIYNTEEYITEMGLNASSAKVFPIDTVVVAMYGATAGQVGILKIEAATNQAVCGILPNDLFIPEFLFWYLITKKEKLLKLGSGGAQPNISQHIIREIKVPIVSKDSQKYIVGNVERKINQVRNIGQKVKGQLESINHYLNCVIQSAFRADRFLNRKWVKLSNFTTKIGSGATPKGGQASYQSTGIPLIRSQNVHFNRFEYQGLAFINQEQNDLLYNSIVQPGDVLLNITGASIGRVCVVPEEICPANVNQHVCIIRPRSEFLPEFISYFIANPSFQAEILGLQSGATRQALTKEQISNFELPLIEVEEQRVILEQVKNRLNKALELKQNLIEQISVLDSLPLVILREAFDGEK